MYIKEYVGQKIQNWIRFRFMFFEEAITLKETMLR